MIVHYLTTEKKNKLHLNNVIFHYSDFKNILILFSFQYERQNNLSPPSQWSIIVIYMSSFYFSLMTFYVKCRFHFGPNIGIQLM